MRRHVLSIVFLMVFVGAAATGGAQTLTGGVKLGVNIASMPAAGQVLDQVVGRASSESSSKAGFFVGGFATIPVWNGLSLQPELTFTGKGVKLTEFANAGTVTASVRYLEFPILVRYAFADTDAQLKPYVMVGPTFGVKASTSALLDAPGATKDIDIDPAMRSFDGGLAGVFGVEYDRYLAEVRYTLGLSDIAADKYAHADALHSRTLTFAAGIKFK